MNSQLKKQFLLQLGMDSSRLLKKAVAHVYDKEFSIEHLINRVKHSELADLIILCTTRNSSDDVL